MLDKLYPEITAGLALPRSTPRRLSSRLSDFIEDGGYSLRVYDRYKKLQLNEDPDGLYELTHAALRSPIPHEYRHYRRSTGLESHVWAGKTAPVRHRRIFRQPSHRPATRSSSRDKSSNYEGLRDMVVQVSRTNSGTPKNPEL